MLVRKCSGKSKSEECLQGGEHNYTRWECGFGSQNKEDLKNHAKNILKRTKWKDMVENAKADKDGVYHCPYNSTDRHHVENHHQKGTQAALSPSPQQRTKRKRTTEVSNGKPPLLNGNGIPKRWVNSFTRREGEEDYGIDGLNIPPEIAAREMKRLRQDAVLLGLFQESHASDLQGQVGGDDKDGIDKGVRGLQVVASLPDNTKIEDVLETVQKRLELPLEMIHSATEKLHSQGFVIVAGLKSLKRNGWEKLDLPLAIEDELKTQIHSPKKIFHNPSTYSANSTDTPSGFNMPLHWHYTNSQQPVYFPYPIYEQDLDSEVDKEEKSEKEVVEESSTEVPLAPTLRPLSKAIQEATLVNDTTIQTTQEIKH